MANLKDYVECGNCEEIYNNSGEVGINACPYCGENKPLPVFDLTIDNLDVVVKD